MKSLISILVLFLTINCNQKENDLKFIEDYINTNNLDLSHVYLNINSKNTKSVLEAYKYNFTNSLDEDISSNEWFIKDNKWPFTIEELNNIKAEEINHVWSNPQMVHPTIKTYNNLKGKSKKEIESFARNQSQVITISKPLFNSKKTKAMFFYRKNITIDSFSDNYIVVLVKENNKWMVVGKVFSSMLY